MIESQRLLLREWRESDLEAFAGLCADAGVMEHFPSTLTPAQSAEFVARIRQHFVKCGYGFWAVECRNGPPFIGFVGLMQVGFNAPFTPAVEIGWRLAREAWGRGYASEAASAALRWAFESLELDEVVSFTVPANTRSWKVMERIGMRRSPADDFDHPRLPQGDPLRRHILYRMRALDWSLASEPGRD